MFKGMSFDLGCNMSTNGGNFSISTSSDVQVRGNRFHSSESTSIGKSGLSHSQSTDTNLGKMYGVHNSKSQGIGRNGITEHKEQSEQLGSCITSRSHTKNLGPDGLHQKVTYSNKVGTTTVLECTEVSSISENGVSYHIGGTANNTSMDSFGDIASVGSTALLKTHQTELDNERTALKSYTMSSSNDVPKQQHAELSSGFFNPSKMFFTPPSSKKTEHTAGSDCLTRFLALFSKKEAHEDKQLRSDTSRSNNDVPKQPHTELSSGFFNPSKMFFTPPCSKKTDHISSNDCLSGASQGI